MSGGKLKKEAEYRLWLFIFAASIAAFIAGTVYMTLCVGRTGLIGSLAGHRTWLKYLLAFLILTAFVFVTARLSSPANAVVFFLHAVLFFLIWGAVLRAAAPAFGKRFSPDLRGILAIVSMAVYLPAGYLNLCNVCRTDYVLQSDKAVSLKIAMLADSHIGTSFDGEGFAEHIKTIEAQGPDLLVVAGDFVDDGTKKEDMLRACKALGDMKTKYGVWFAYGNHDKGYFEGRGFSFDELERELLANGVHVLADECEAVGGAFYIAGRKDRTLGERKTMDELLAGADTDRYIIVIDHVPDDYENEADSAADLVLSGHTHGGQFFPIAYIDRCLGINDLVYGHERRKGTDFIVTSGISGWEIRIKTGARSEYVMINVDSGR